MLIGASSSILAKYEASTLARYFTSRPVSYANVVRGATGGVRTLAVEGVEM